jgi:hypothetical protein
MRIEYSLDERRFSGLACDGWRVIESLALVISIRASRNAMVSAKTPCVARLCAMLIPREDSVRTFEVNWWGETRRDHETVIEAVTLEKGSCQPLQHQGRYSRNETVPEAAGYV